MIILKFGGSSLNSSDHIRRVIEIIDRTNKEYQEIAVVVSAFGGVTEELIRISREAVSGENDYVQRLKKLEDRHMEMVKACIYINCQSHLLATVKMMFNELEDVLHGVQLVKELTMRTLDFILSFGERLSAYIITCICSQDSVPAEYLDSRDMVKTNADFGFAKVDVLNTFKNIEEYFSAHPLLQIITGFIGSTCNNETTTLGRGGSDYTASIFGAALHADEIQICTDVNGVLTGDPRKIPHAFPILHMTYKEAMEMSHFGAKVIYPPTIQPALECNIPVRIKNTFDPDAEGTLITADSLSQHIPVRGISSIENISLVNVEGSGMIGVTGIAGRLFSALAREHINIILITQASSEHSICFAVQSVFVEAAKDAVEKEFALEMQAHHIDDLAIENELTIIAVVGEYMRKTPGIAGKVFRALGQNNINIIAIAQGSSELNISFVVKKSDEIAALNAIHETFFGYVMETKNLQNHYNNGNRLIAHS